MALLGRLVANPADTLIHRRQKSLLEAPLHLCALVALIATAVALGCRSSGSETAQEAIAAGTSRTRQVVTDAVDDPERRAQALEIVESYAERERAFLDQSLEYRKEIARLHADHGTTRAQYEAKVEVLAAHREAFAEDMLSGWLALQDLLEDDELAALVKGQREEEERWLSMIDD